AGPARGRALTLAGCPVVAVARGLAVARRPVAIVAATRGLPIAGCPVVTAIAGALAVGGCQDPVGALGRPLEAQRAAVDRDGDGDLGAVGQHPHDALALGAVITAGSAAKCSLLDTASSRSPSSAVIEAVRASSERKVEVAVMSPSVSVSCRRVTVTVTSRCDRSAPSASVTRSTTACSPST